MTSLGCSVGIQQRSIVGVAVEAETIYVVGAGGAWAFDSSAEGQLARPAALDVPCAEPVDVEVHAAVPYVLCRDGRVFARESGRLDESTPTEWREQVASLQAGSGEALQRSDKTLYRVERVEWQPRPESPPLPSSPAERRLEYYYPIRAIVSEAGHHVVEEWLPTNLWHGGYAVNPATSNEDGSAFLFTAKMHRRTRLSLISHTQGNLHCRTSRWFRAVDAAVDAEGRTFVVVSDSELVVIRFDARGSVHASAHDPATGERRRGRISCMR